MAVTALSIAKLGLNKLAASDISSLSPPRSRLERAIAEGYPVWRDFELKSHDWVFALAVAKMTVSDGPLPGLDLPYRFPLPGDCLRVHRTKTATWVQAGNDLYADGPEDFYVQYVARRPEDLFPADFQMVLGARIAIENVEIATGSNTKAVTAQSNYQALLDVARRNNAFVVGPQDTTLDDMNSDWLMSRAYPGG